MEWKDAVLCRIIQLDWQKLNAKDHYSQWISALVIHLLIHVKVEKIKPSEEKVFDHCPGKSTQYGCKGVATVEQMQQKAKPNTDRGFHGLVIASFCGWFSFCWKIKQPASANKTCSLFWSFLTFYKFASSPWLICKRRKSEPMFNNCFTQHGLINFRNFIFLSLESLAENKGAQYERRFMPTACNDTFVKVRMFWKSKGHA